MYNSKNDDSRLGIIMIYPYNHQNRLQMSPQASFCPFVYLTLYVSPTCDDIHLPQCDVRSAGIIISEENIPNMAVGRARGRHPQRPKVDEYVCSRSTQSTPSHAYLARGCPEEVERSSKEQKPSPTGSSVVGVSAALTTPPTSTRYVP